MRRLYLGLSIVGLVVPYYFLARFLVAHGLDIPLLVQLLFANNISTFFAVDVLISSLALWVFVYQEAGRHEMKHWWLFIVANLVAGVSFALPLFLYFRQARIESLGRPGERNQA